MNPIVSAVKPLTYHQQVILHLCNKAIMWYKCNKMWDKNQMPLSIGLPKK